MMYQYQGSPSRTDPLDKRLSDKLFPRKSIAEKHADSRPIFTRLYEEHKEPLIKRIADLVGNRETAYDICQEAFTKMWTKYFAYTSVSDQVICRQFEPLLYTIAYNRAFDYLRYERRHKSVPLPEDEPSGRQGYELYEHPNLHQAGHEEKVCNDLFIQDALAMMSEQYRICVLLQDEGGLMQWEIAEMLGISVSAVRSNVSRGHEQLRKICAKLLSEKSTTTKGGRERHGKINLRSF